MIYFFAGTYAPRSLFDRHPAFQKQKLKAQQKRLPLGSGSYVHGPLPANFQPQNAVSSLRQPLPRQQVEAENQPEWLIQEDWALLHTIKDVQVNSLELFLENSKGQLIPKGNFVVFKSTKKATNYF